MTREEFASLSTEQAAGALWPLFIRQGDTKSAISRLEKGAWDTPRRDDFDKRGRVVDQLVDLGSSYFAGWIAQLLLDRPDEREIIAALESLRIRYVSSVIDAILSELVT